MENQLILKNEYQEEKLKKKQKLERNEFKELANMECH